MLFKTIEGAFVVGQRVLMRVDFNVPLDGQGRIADDRRIRAALPSVDSVITRAGRLVLMSHLGRPKTPDDRTKLSLKPIANRLQEILGHDVAFVGSVVGEDVHEKVNNLRNGEVLLLENLRFHPGETEGDPDFARSLADLGHVYCNDAFGACHRRDASLVAVPLAFRPRPKVAGLLLAKEVHILAELTTAAARPFVAVVGGAKVSDKFKFLRRLVEVCDRVLIGGAMANTFALARGGQIGNSLAEPDHIGAALQLLESAGSRIMLPTDLCCADELRLDVIPRAVPFGQVPAGMTAYDIGPVTVESFAREIYRARTILWNGPMGVFETPPFDAGTRAVAQAIASTRAYSVVGGGETAAALDRFRLSARISHVSTGGGATLAFLAGEKLPALEVLDKS